MRVQKEYGLHESLAHLHQQRKVVLVALIVDPSGRCLMIDGDLPQEEHECLGTQKCALPFIERVLHSGLGLSKQRVYGSARTYDDVQEDGSSKGTYVIARVDMRESRPVPCGEWVATAERAVELARGNEVPLRCIQKFFPDQLAWKLPAKQLS